MQITYYPIVISATKKALRLSPCFNLFSPDFKNGILPFPHAEPRQAAAFRRTVAQKPQAVFVTIIRLLSPPRKKRFGFRRALISFPPISKTGYCRFRMRSLGRLPPFGGQSLKNRKRFLLRLSDCYLRHEKSASAFAVRFSWWR